MTSAAAVPPNSSILTGSTHAPSGSYNLAIGYLRAFITLLVVAHHSVLAYHPYAPPLTCESRGTTALVAGVSRD